jgi:hypothetical protein
VSSLLCTCITIFILLLLVSWFCHWHPEKWLRRRSWKKNPTKQCMILRQLSFEHSEIVHWNSYKPPRKVSVQVQVLNWRAEETLQFDSKIYHDQNYHLNLLYIRLIMQQSPLKFSAPLWMTSWGVLSFVTSPRFPPDCDVSNMTVLSILVLFVI